MVIEKIKEKNHGFVTDADLPEIIKENENQMLLVRCGYSRFVTTANNLNHFIEVIETSDYVRDVSFVNNTPEEIKTLPKIITNFGCLWTNYVHKDEVVKIINDSKLDSVNVIIVGSK